MSKIIVLTGPESTAKSTLAKELASYFNGTYYPEYAREYLSGKGGSYSFSDIEHIARKQIEQYEQARNAGKEELVFLDTWLIITRVWMEWVYNKVPAWVEQAIKDHPVDLYLLCCPDIPWEPDPLRENGGEQREQLFQRYKKELQTRGFLFAEVTGKGKERIRNAIDAVKLNT